MEKLLTVEAVANLLSLSESQIYSLAKRQLIPCHKFGASIRFKEADLEEWVDKHKQELRTTRKA